ncbi:hypothetical protein Anacy_6181 (plasmid) [Anabaena cylindrica PCC 7122]|uniref:Uncharacterized protein n=1 Tax=Anabaena cylindrica (strain ATCC 27899 / PCC 7122) TaxID=272123 RepID=K9ZSU9_ANACC|nr:hypothetical protein Anacy_6181 [Anabaena cylindrica PCC 7122]
MKRIKTVVSFFQIVLIANAIPLTINIEELQLRREKLSCFTSNTFYEWNQTIKLTRNYINDIQKNLNRFFQVPINLLLI